MPIRIRLTQHFQARQIERGIDIDHIRKAINSPDEQEQMFEDRIKVRKKLEDGREIEVIYFKDGFRGSNDRIVITAYYLEE